MVEEELGEDETKNSTWKTNYPTESEPTVHLS